MSTYFTLILVCLSWQRMIKHGRLQMRDFFDWDLAWKALHTVLVTLLISKSEYFWYSQILGLHSTNKIMWSVISCITVGCLSVCGLRNALCLSHYRTTVEVCRKPSTAAKNKRGTFMIVTGVGRNIVVRKEWSKSISRLYFSVTLRTRALGNPLAKERGGAW